MWDIALEHFTQATLGSRSLAALMESSVLYSVTNTHGLDWAATNDHNFLP